MTIDWDHVYLLGWYGDDIMQPGRRKSYFTSWSGNAPMVRVIVTGSRFGGPPMWNAPVPPGAQLHAIPPDRDAEAYARELGGVEAFGWYVADGLNPPRGEPLPSYNPSSVGRADSVDSGRDPQGAADP